MYLAIGCIIREFVKYGRLQNELLEWRTKCFAFTSFCTLSVTNAVDFNTLWNKLKYKNSSFSDDNKMVVISVEIKDYNSNNPNSMYIYKITFLIAIIKNKIVYIYKM
jgi:hypothetical protein